MITMYKGKKNTICAAVQCVVMESRIGSVVWPCTAVGRSRRAASDCPCDVMRGPPDMLQFDMQVASCAVAFVGHTSTSPIGHGHAGEAAEAVADVLAHHSGGSHDLAASCIHSLAAIVSRRGAWMGWNGGCWCVLIRDRDVARLVQAS